MNLLRGQDDVIKGHGVAATGGILAGDGEFERVARGRDIKSSEIKSSEGFGGVVLVNGWTKVSSIDGELGRSASGVFLWWNS